MNDLVHFHAPVKFDLERRAVGLHGGQKLPDGRLAVHLDVGDVDMARIQDNVRGFRVGDGLELMDDISHQLLLIEENVKVGRDVGGQPIVVIAQGVGIPGRVDGGRHGPGLERRELHGPTDSSGSLAGG